jgi:ubiquinone/menaquinone biosynthesis C-methylase UbiE
MPASMSAARTERCVDVATLPLHLLRCPVTGATLSREGDTLRSAAGPRYPVSGAGIPLFAAEALSEDARRQQAHYDAIAQAYEENLRYPHTRAYFDYLDGALFEALGSMSLGTMAEICCGTGAAVKLLEGRYVQAVAVDISTAMLERGARENDGRSVTFAQGDATRLPLADTAFDSVVMLGGIHHINDRAALFAEVARILKPGGVFVFREPVSDFVLWRLLRALIYRISPMLDHRTERPLLWRETGPPLEAAGLRVGHWSTHGFLGFCLFMNSDVLFFNRLFRFIPGIATVTRAAAKLDAWMLRLPGLRRAGLQVVGIAGKT